MSTLHNNLFTHNHTEIKSFFCNKCCDPSLYIFHEKIRSVVILSVNFTISNNLVECINYPLVDRIEGVLNKYRVFNGSYTSTLKLYIS